MIKNKFVLPVIVFFVINYFLLALKFLGIAGLTTPFLLLKTDQNYGSLLLAFISNAIILLSFITSAFYIYTTLTNTNRAFKKESFLRNVTIAFCSACFFLLYNLFVTTPDLFTNFQNPLQLVYKIFRFFPIVKFVFLFVCLLSIIIFIVSVKPEKLSMGEYLFRNRFVISALILCFLVFFKISGSSIGEWRHFIPSPGYEPPIFGVNRGIRSDEYGLFTPLFISQYNNPLNKFPYYNELIRGTTTDVFFLYDVPVKDFSLIFRPFQIVSMFLGVERGFSFWWNSRFIALFLVSLQFMMLISNDKLVLSFIGTLMIVFSPFIQWWGAVGGFIDLFIWGQLSILLLRKFLISEKILGKLLSLSGIVICIGGYILTVYPPFMIPYFYILFPIFLYVLISCMKKYQFHRNDFIISSIALIVLAVFLGRIVIKSENAISGIAETVYPGKRVSIGGGFASLYTLNPLTVFYPILESLQFKMPLGNVCESAVFFDLFPFSIFIAFLVLYQQKKKDPLLLLMLASGVFLGYYTVIGLPELLAKVSFLSKSTPIRTGQIGGVLNIYILIRALSQFNNKIESTKKIIISIFFSLLSILGISVFYSRFLTPLISILICIVTFITVYLFLVFACNPKSKSLLVWMTALMFLTGGLVNPIQKGIYFLHNNSLFDAIYQITRNDNSLWVVDGGYPISNFPITAGARTLNSTQIYPNIDLWKKLDTKGELNHIYNRYAHLVVTLLDESIEDNIILRQNDVIQVSLAMEDLIKLDVKYILSTRDLDSLLSANNHIEELVFDEESIAPYKIFKIN